MSTACVEIQIFYSVISHFSSLLSLFFLSHFSQYLFLGFLWLPFVWVTRCNVMSVALFVVRFSLRYRSLISAHRPANWRRGDEKTGHWRLTIRSESGQSWSNRLLNFILRRPKFIYLLNFFLRSDNNDREKCRENSKSEMKGTAKLYCSLRMLQENFRSNFRCWVQNTFSLQNFPLRLVTLQLGV